MWTTTMLVAPSAFAQSETCMDGAALWSTAALDAQAAARMIDAGVSLSDRDTSVQAVKEISTSVDEIAQPVVAPTRSEDVQWCVDSSDPRCSPDPAGSPAAHLAHAGDAARVTTLANVAAAPLSIVRFIDAAERCLARGVRSSIERPPQAR